MNSGPHWNKVFVILNLRYHAELQSSTSEFFEHKVQHNLVRRPVLHSLSHSIKHRLDHAWSWEESWWVILQASIWSWLYIYFHGKLHPYIILHTYMCLVPLLIGIWWAAYAQQDTSMHHTSLSSMIQNRGVASCGHLIKFLDSFGVFLKVEAAHLKQVLRDNWMSDLW